MMPRLPPRHELAVKRVLFVCTGNICRSPTAEAILRKHAKEQGLDVVVDSAGTHGYHIGEAPDPRSVKAGARRGYDLSTIRARKITREDFERFDYLIALDEGHLALMQAACPVGLQHKLHAMMVFAPQLGYSEVPDPYYGPAAGFEQVIDLLEAATTGLVKTLLHKA